MVSFIKQNRAVQSLIHKDWLSLLFAFLMMTFFGLGVQQSTAWAISSENLKSIRAKYSYFHKTVKDGLKTFSSDRITPGIGNQMLELRVSPEGAVLHYFEVPYQTRDIEMLFDSNGNVLFYYLKYERPSNVELLSPSDTVVENVRLYFVEGHLERIDREKTVEDSHFSPADLALSSDAQALSKLVYKFVVQPSKSDENMRALRKYIYPTEAPDKKQESEMDPNSLLELSAEMNVDRAKNKLVVSFYFTNVSQYQAIALSTYDLDRDLYVQDLDSESEVEVLELTGLNPLTDGPHEQRRRPPGDEDIVYAQPADEARVERSYNLTNIAFYSRNSGRWQLNRVKPSGVYHISFCYESTASHASDPKILKLLDKQISDHLWVGKVCSNPVTLTL